MAKKTDSTKDIAGENLLPEGIKLSTLKSYWDMANEEYATPRNIVTGKQIGRAHV